MLLKQKVADHKTILGSYPLSRLFHCVVSSVICAHIII